MGTGICAEHFLYNENNLTNCSTQRNSPPIPPHHHPPPPPPLYYHIKAPSSEQVFSFKNGSEQREGGGEDKTEAVGVDPRLSLLLSPVQYVCV